MTRLPERIVAEPDKDELAVHAEYIRKLQNLSQNGLARALCVTPRAIQQRETTGYGLQKQHDIAAHFSALGYDMHIVFTRKVKT